MADVATRPTRADEVRTERRRKPGSVVLPGVNLAVDESKVDRSNYAYRWVNDTASGRIAQLESQDWDIAPEQAALGNQGEGSVQARNVGSENGKPMRAVLMRKPIKMHAEDQAAKMRPLDELEEALKRGDTGQKTSDPQLAGGAGTYTPGGSNTIGA